MPDTALLGTLVFAVTAGVATFFAPCAFPLLPGYVGFYLRQRDGDGVLAPAFAAAFGALVALGAVGAVGFTLGQAVVSSITYLEPVTGIALVAFGVLLLSGRAPEVEVLLPARPTSVLGMGVFGAVYALAAAGCVVPIFLGLIAQSMTLPFADGLLVFGVYAGSVSLPLVGVTLLAEAGIDAWRGLGRHVGSLQRVAAGVMILAGLGQLYLSLVVLDVV